MINIGYQKSIAIIILNDKIVRSFSLNSKNERIAITTIQHSFKGPFVL